MFLDIWNSIRTFFYNMFEKFSLSSLFTLIFGIAIGILICLFVYVIYLVGSINKQEEDNKLKSNNDDIKEVDIEKVKKNIKAIQDEYKEASSEMNATEKFKLVKELSVNLATNIALMFYPNSKHPLFELSVEELIKLNYYITNRIEHVIDGSVLKYFKKKKISLVLNILDKKREIEDSKIIKSAKKMHIGGVASIIKNAINFLNPVYYAKKAGINLTVNIGTDKIAKIIFEIVGEETAKIYSKNIFVMGSNDSNSDDVIIDDISSNDIENNE